jgi:hypothetical protein
MAGFKTPSFSKSKSVSERIIPSFNCDHYIVFLKVRK